MIIAKQNTKKILLLVGFVLLAFVSFTNLTYAVAYSIGTPQGGWTHESVLAQKAILSKEYNDRVISGSLDDYSREVFEGQLKELDAMDRAYSLIESGSTDQEALGQTMTDIRTSMDHYPEGSSQAQAATYLWNSLGAQKHPETELGKRQAALAQEAKQGAITAAAKEAESKKQVFSSGCDRGATNGFGLGDLQCWLEWLATALMTVVWLFGWILWGINEIFNMVMQISVRDFNKFLNTDGLKQVWGIARDLVNVSLLFVLLYAAIGMILDLRNVDGKRIVTNVIVVALLINFSFFFTGVAITASNTVANFLYSRAGGDLTCDGSDSARQNDNCSASGAPDITTKIAKNTLIQPKSAVEQFDGGEYTLGNIISNFASRMALVIITSVVLGAGAIMFMVRMVKLLLLAALSPLAFLGFTVPAFKKRADDWLQSLISLSVFPIIFLLFMVLATEMAGSSDTWWTFPKDAFHGASLVSSLVIGILVNGIMVAGLLAASSMGSGIAQMATKKLAGIGNWTKAKIGQGTLGRLGYTADRLLSSDKGQDFRAKYRIIGGALKNLSEKVSKAGYGNKGTSYQKTVEAKAKVVEQFDSAENKARYVKSLGTPILGRIPIVNRAFNNSQQAAFAKLKPDQQAEVISSQQPENNPEVKIARDALKTKREELAKENTTTAQELNTLKAAYDKKSKELEANIEDYDKLPLLDSAAKMASQTKKKQLEQERDAITSQIATLKQNASPKAQVIIDEIAKLDKQEADAMKQAMDNSAKKGSANNVLARIREKMTDKQRKGLTKAEEKMARKKKQEEFKKKKARGETLTEEEQKEQAQIEEAEREERAEEQRQLREKVDKLEKDKEGGGADKGGDKKDEGKKDEK